MEAILYICHGSRIHQACEQAVSFIKRCMKKSKNKIQEYGFLEFAAPTIEEAFQRCVERGANNIKVIPVFLLTAVHAKEDIPAELIKLKEKFPAVEFQYGRPIGVHPKMVDILTERLYETNRILSAKSTVLLVGRGSSDPNVRKDLGQIAHLLKQKIRFATVKDCYLTGAGLSFEVALNTAKKSNAQEIFIIPYLLFTGILMNSMKKKICQISQETDKWFVLCNYLGYHPSIEWILKERVLELGDERKKLCIPS